MSLEPDAPASLSPVSMSVDEEDALPESWFEPRRSSLPPRPSSLPPPVQTLGAFLGDPLADAWLR